MNQYIHRTVRAVVAAACMATLGMALITTAAPNANLDQNAQDQSTSSSSSSSTGDSDQSDDLDNQASKTPPLTGDANNPPGLHNNLMNLEAPKVKTASYSKHDARHCYGFDGSEDVPGHNKVQHPCQAKHNSVHKGDAQFFGHSV
jgi:hypothetical protein